MVLGGGGDEACWGVIRFNTCLEFELCMKMSQRPLLTPEGTSSVRAATKRKTELSNRAFVVYNELVSDTNNFQKWP